MSSDNLIVQYSNQKFRSNGSQILIKPKKKPVTRTLSYLIEQLPNNNIIER